MDQPVSCDPEGHFEHAHGPRAKIWRDEKLQAMMFFPMRSSQFNQSAVLVSIVTSRYLNSEWCTREGAEILSTQQTGGWCSATNRVCSRL
jgi:hypothetical protein